MPAGRPRIYATHRERLDHHNTRRRRARRAAILADLSSPSPTPGSLPDDEDRQGLVLAYKDHVTTVTSPPGDVFQDLSQSLGGLAVLDPLEDNTQHLEPVAPTVRESPARESPGEAADWEVDVSMSDAEALPSPPPAPAPNPATQALAHQLVDQLLQHHGCPDHGRRVPRGPHATTLSQLVALGCPDVLARADVKPHPTDWATSFPAAAQRRLFSGIQTILAPSHAESTDWPPQAEDLPPPELDLDADARDLAGDQFTVYFDIDSVGGFARSLVVARQGLSWMAVQPPTSSLTSAIHLDRIPVQFLDAASGQWRSTQAPIHHLPHLPLRHLEGLEAIELLLHYHLPAPYLPRLWERVLHYLPRHTEFQGARLLLHAKNLKARFQQGSWRAMHDRFFATWHTAVDPAWIESDWYDITKEVITLGRSFPSHQAPPWLSGCARQLRGTQPDATANRPPAGSARAGSPPPPRARPQVQVVVPGAGPSTPASVEAASSAGSLRDPSWSPGGSPEPAEPPSQPPWTEVFYPLSLAQDMGSLTIEPHLGRQSPLRRHGLLYLQLYNTSKGIFAAGNTYPFGNRALDTLSLDAGLVRAWQHIGGAVSHSPHTILRAYLHTKARCHAALTGSCHTSYGTREEYRVTGALLHLVHTAMMAQLGSLDPMRVHAPHSTGGRRRLPFWIHPTWLFVDWLRWNLNRLCLGFELVYTLQPHTMIHWEHTHVMMMFLRCLTYVYGGDGAHPSHSNGLWVDRRVRPLVDGSEVERVQEGMGLQVTLEHYRYGWFLDKLDCEAMIFRQPHRPHMVFNTPSLLSQYFPRYRHLVTARDEFIQFQDLYSHLTQAREEPGRAARLLDLLIDLCLQTFRQEVFRALQLARTNQPLSEGGLRCAVQGAVPLTAPGFRQVFRRAPLETEFQFVSGPTARIRDVGLLFSFLWGWAGDGNQGGWERAGWEQKLYRLLYRRTFEMITQIFGIGQARAWRASLYTKLFWSRTTGVPGRDQARMHKLQVWYSHHPGVSEYYKAHGTDQDMIPAVHVNQLPIVGWRAHPRPGLLTVELPDLPDDASVPFSTVSTMTMELSTAALPLPIIKVQDGPIRTGITALDPQRRYLTRQLQSETGSHPDLEHLGALHNHQDPGWITDGLSLWSSQVAGKFRQEYLDVRLPRDQDPLTAKDAIPAVPTIMPIGHAVRPADLEYDSDPDSVGAYRRKVFWQYKKVFE
ncbi:hypothetical protein BDW71DRAFT_212801 [Aspergillus fruticulosus]